MTFDETRKRTLERIERETDRTLAGVGQLLDLDAYDADRAALVAGRVAEKLRAMPPEDRRAALLRTALALSDLQALCRSMSGELDALGDEISRVGSHSAATAAYQRSRLAAANRR
jgi:acyl-CoA reductase-like NAD-dependent aldehyde dehydrogenase